MEEKKLQQAKMPKPEMSQGNVTQQPKMPKPEMSQGNVTQQPKMPKIKEPRLAPQPKLDLSEDEQRAKASELFGMDLNRKRAKAMSKLTEAQRKLVDEDSRAYSAKRDDFHWNNYLTGNDLDEYNRLTEEAYKYGKLADDEEIPSFYDDTEFAYDIDNRQAWHENGQKYVSAINALNKFLEGKHNPEVEAFHKRLDAGLRNLQKNNK